MAIKRFAIIPAAGKGMRFGQAQPKQYLHIVGDMVLNHTLRHLAQSGVFDLMVLVLSEDDAYFDVTRLPAECQLCSLDEVAQGLSFAATSRNNAMPTPLWVLTCGGDTRAQTVKNALAALRNEGLAQDNDHILVHDAARCAITTRAIHRLIDQVGDYPYGGILTLPVNDTVKYAIDGQRIDKTLSRSGLFVAQTPQLFPMGLLQNALDRADPKVITDEASAVESLGYQPLMVVGETRNIKLTYPEDREVLSLFLRKNTMKKIRVGQGYDVHELVDNRPLILGGVHIPFAKGLKGHSDADALLHAITDAILGAAGLGDIGQHFPDTNTEFLGADSRVLLKEAYRRVQQEGWQLVNIDATLIAQKPKLAPYLAQMKQHIAEDLQMASSLINIKGKTNEGLGYLGRNEAIEAQVAVLLEDKG